MGTWSEVNQVVSSKPGGIVPWPSVQGSSHAIHTREEVIPKDVLCSGIQLEVEWGNLQVCIQAASGLCSHLCLFPLRRKHEDVGSGGRGVLWEDSPGRGCGEGSALT